MKFSKDVTTVQPSHPQRPPTKATDLITLDQVAQTLQVSRRYVQSLVRRKVIPVIRIGKRCTRFNLAKVLAAIERFEIEEYGRK
jgi:excisionase family DNA binding protein